MSVDIVPMWNIVCMQLPFDSLFVGTPCIYPSSDAMNPRATHSQNNDDLIVSLGISDESTVSFQQCNVTLQCQNCSTPTAYNTVLQSCTSDVQYSNIPEGAYTISGNISTECGELIAVGPVSTYVGKLQHYSISTVSLHNSVVLSTLYVECFYQGGMRAA